MLNINETIKQSMPFVFFVLVLVALSYIGIAKLKYETNNTVRDSLQSMLVAVQESHHLVFQQRKMAIETLIESASVNQLLMDLIDSEGNNEVARQSLQEKLSPMLNNFNDQGYFLIDSNFEILVSNNKGRAKINAGIFNNYFQFLQKAFQGETTFIPPIEFQSLPNPQTFSSASSSPYNQKFMAKFIVSPITSAQGNTIGLLAIQLDPNSYFSNIARLGRVGETGETYVFNKDGILLTESRFRHHLLRANLINLDEYGVYNLKITDPGGNLLAGYKPKLTKETQPFTLMAASALQGNSGYNLDGYRDYRGVTVVGAWVWIKEFNVGLATEIDLDEAYQPYYQTRNVFILITIAVLLLTILLVRVIHRAHKTLENHMQYANAQLEVSVNKRTEELVAAQQELSQANEELIKQAMTDGLTGIANRRQFDACLENEWRRCLREKTYLSVILLDLDYFKKYNDCYGHTRGDQCLKTIANALVNADVAKRPGDLFARYGGEEFVILLSNTSPDYTRETSFQIREVIKSLHIPHRENKASKTASVTASIGYACLKINGEMNAETLVDYADKALYQAKDSGRDNVCDYITISSPKISKLHKGMHKPLP